MKNIKNKWPFFSESSDKINLFIHNISGIINSYQNNSHLIPIFINKNSKCWIASLETFDLLYKDAFKRLQFIKPTQVKLIKLILMLRFFPGRLANINRCVFFNHNMMSTTLWPEIQDIDLIISKFSREYPKHPIIFRSLNVVHNKKLIDALINEKCKLLRIREIALFDPQKKLTKKQRQNLKSDRKLLNSGDHQVIKTKFLTDSDIGRLWELYTQIYIEKYPGSLNPKYTLSFFTSILDDPRYEIFLLKKEGKIDAFALIEQEGSLIQCPCLGYDTSLPEQLGLYRKISAVVDHYCIENHLLFNESSGVYKFKQRRGCELTSEYYAIYYKHLSMFKRFFWAVYIYLSNQIPKIGK